MDKLNAEVFLKIVETGSFRKTADSLGYTQAGISYIVSAMEEELGLHLFVREHNGVRLSSEGEALQTYFNQLLSLERQFGQRVNELKGLQSGIVRVQIFDSISIHWIPNIIRRFHDDYPGITIELTSEEDSVRAEEMVLNGEVDCGFFPNKVQGDMDVFPLMEEKRLAVVSWDHPLAEKKCFPLKELGNYPYISMKYDEHTGVKEIFQAQGITPMTAFCMDNDFAAMAMVSQGLGFAIFPELLVKNVPYDIRLMDFDHPQKRRVSIGTKSYEGCSIAARKFIDYTRLWVEESIEAP